MGTLTFYTFTITLVPNPQQKGYGWWVVIEGCRCCLLRIHMERVGVIRLHWAHVLAKSNYPLFLGPKIFKHV